IVIARSREILRRLYRRTRHIQINIPLLVLGNFLRELRIAVQISRGIITRFRILTHRDITLPNRRAGGLLTVQLVMAAFHFPAAAFIVRAGSGIGVSAGVAAGAEADAQVVAFFLVVVLQITEAECAGIEVQVAAVGAVIFDVGDKGAVHLRMVADLDVHRLGANQAGLFRYPRAAAVGFAVADTGTTAHACANGNTAAGIPAFAVYAAGVLQGFRVQVVAYLYVQVLRLQVGSTDRGVVAADHGQGVPGGDVTVAVVDVFAVQVVFTGADIGGKADAVAAEV